MNLEEFLYLRYRDNVINIREFKNLLLKNYNIIGDPAIRIINRIFDYQRNCFGSVLNNDIVWYTREELEHMRINANVRKNKARLLKERR